jgi:uncharacterized membrane protein
MPRYLSVDLLRGVAILLMVQVHFVDNLSSQEASSAWLYRASAWLGMLPAPMFTLLSGLSFGLWARKQQASGVSDRDITAVAVRRGLFLFAAGLVFNFFAWLPEETFNWDVLTLIGSALVILAYARKLPAEILALLCVVVVLVSPPLRVISDHTAYWKDSAYVYDLNFRDVVWGYFLNGYFPLLPWVIFPLVGFVISEVAFGDDRSASARLAAVGTGLMMVAALLFLFGKQLPAFLGKHYAEGVAMNPTTTEYTLGALGFCMVCLAAMHCGIDAAEPSPSPGIVVRFLQRWSVFSLTIYLLHHFAHLWPLWLYAVWMGQDDVTHYWRQAISTPVAAALTLAFIVVADLLLRFLERHKRWSFEALMRRVSG